MLLKPTFTERTALEIRERILGHLRKHFHDPANCGGPRYSAAEPRKHFIYQFPLVSDFADGSFDDVSESVFLRVLKDMNNLGTLNLRRSATHNGRQRSRFARSFSCAAARRCVRQSR